MQDCKPSFTSTNADVQILKPHRTDAGEYQIRKEAVSIFYAENEFNVDLQDFKCAATCSWEAKVARNHDKLSAPLRVTTSGNLAPNWQNLLTWMRHSHEGRTGSGLALSVVPGKAWNTECLVIREMFSLVKAMLDKPWETVEELLLQQRDVLSRLNAQWGQ